MTKPNVRPDAANTPSQPSPAADAESIDAALLENAPEALAEEMAALKQKLDETQQSWLRAQADLENYRKRTRRDLEEERRYALMPLLHDLLPVMDNFQRALDVMQDSGLAADMKTGVQMVALQLQQVLAQHHCYPIDAEGRPFDPMYHEAIGQESTSQQPPQTVLRVQQTGYRLHDRVIRPAKVIVASAAEPSPGTR